MPSEDAKKKTSIFSKSRVVAIVVVVFSIFFYSVDIDLYGQIITSLPYDESNAFLGKKVWITGGSSGIGRSLALELCTAGKMQVMT